MSEEAKLTRLEVVAMPHLRTNQLLHMQKKDLAHFDAPPASSEWTPDILDEYPVKTIQELTNWTCNQCHQQYRFFEVKQPIAFVSDPERKQIIVCAKCLKELHRTQRGQFVEYH